jgi:PPM family protein phosphatase
MGATLTLLLVGADKAAMAHVGDTRLYLVRDGSAHVLSTDHKLGEEMVKAGILTREALVKSPYRNALTRSIGNQERVKADTLVVDVLAGDRFVLCTDGLHDHMQAADDLIPYLEDDPSRTTQALIAFSNASGGHDNVTVITLQMEETDDEEGQHAGSDAELGLEALAGSFLFEDLSWKKLAHVLQIARVVETEAGQRLVSAGDEVTSLILVQEGRLRFERSGGGGRDLTSGLLFGERAIMQHRRARDDLVVEEAGRVQVIDLEDLRALLQRRPGLGLMILERLVRKFVGDLDALENSAGR